jgi:hypothetical protein
MKIQLTLWALVLTLIVSGQALGGDRGWCAPPEPDFLQRLQPVGGCNPYGGGLFHWWKHNCFPRCGGRDDYCRKPIPNVCWPPYPPYYISAPPEIHYSQSAGPRDSTTSH